MSAVTTASSVPAVLAATVTGILVGGALAAVAHPRLLQGRDVPSRRGFVTASALGAGPAVGVLAHRFDGIELLAFGFLACVGVTAATIDVVERRLPRQLVVPSNDIRGGLLAVEAASTGRWTDLMTALVAAVVVALAYLLLALAPGGGLGAGDVTFGALLGMAMGWQGAATVLTGTAVAWTGAAPVLIGHPSLGPPPGSIPNGPLNLVGALGALLLSG